MAEERVPTSRILTYSAPLLAVFASNALLGLYLLNYSTDVLLLGHALVGTLLLVARVWDAVSDPLAGYLSDRTRSRWGRRRPWFAASALPLGLGIVALWSPPAPLEGPALATWFAVAVLVYYTAYTCFRVPHMAMGAELSRGYHDRTRVFGVMQIVENLGMALGAIGLFFLERADDQRSFAGALSVMVAIGVAVLIGVMTVRIRERSEFQGRGGTSPFTSFRDVLSNPHARLLVVIFFAEQLGFSSMIVLLPYLSDYVLETPGSTAIFAGTTLAAMAASIPVWVRVSRRFGKQPTWLFSALVKILVFAAMFTLQAGDFTELLVLVALFGIFMGSGTVIGPSLKADVIDWDEARTGERKEGSYFATWNFAQKAAGGVAIWIVGTSLAMTGYEPGVTQSEGTLLGIRWLAAALPAGLHVIAGALIYRFSLDEAAHRRARAEAGGA